jgi:HlyD family secretion protein
MSSPEQDPRRVIRKLNLVGFALLALMFGGFGVWAATSQLAGAVIAPGLIVVESNVKKVQHPTGGIVGELLVDEGDTVDAGQVVVRLDDTLTRATLGVVRSQLDELAAREARLVAERDGIDTIAFASDLTSRQDEENVATALAGEQKLFESRRSARLGQRSQLRERIAQSDQEVLGLVAQQQAKQHEIEFIGEELVGLSQLYEKKLVPLSRLMVLRRDKARLQGERGQHVAAIARARGRISEIELQILQLDQDFRTELLKELRETHGKMAELRERLIAAEDQLKRVEIRAPQAGAVHELAVHTVGAVISNGQTLMHIVPRADALVLEAKVAPQDIDQIAVGSPAIVRIQAGNQRTMPDIAGALTRVGADLTHEPASGGQEGRAAFVVRVSLAKSEIERLGNMRLVPGMPAVAFIQTYPRTPLQYLLKPLHDQIARTFRER